MSFLLKRLAVFSSILLLFTGCLQDLESNAPVSASLSEEEEGDPAEVVIGERLFLETRFAQFFQKNFNGDFNVALIQGDPVMNLTQALSGNFPGPFKGQSMNCRACHLVDEQWGVLGGGMRTYSDFARRSPIPAREDGQQFAPRNSPALVNATLPHNADTFLHFDGEFSTIEDLVRATLLGRNYGWLADEENEAILHVADVIRFDSGSGSLAQDFSGLSYSELLLGESANIPEEYLLPVEYRLDVSNASSDQILNAVAKLIGAYVNSLVFAQNENGEFAGSPYDVFLQKNNLPARPNPGESDLAYSRRLLDLIKKLSKPQYVSSLDRNFAFHDQEFLFGPTELEGLRIFLSEPPSLPLSSSVKTFGKTGNCLACHAAPAFSDFRFHNTGIAQEEYDSIHGDGSFSSLSIPSLAIRNLNPSDYLPPSSLYPNAAGKFIDIPALNKPGRTDLGLWNRYANEANPKSQAGLNYLLCKMFKDQAASCTPEDLLPFTISLFKTPGLRDLGDSAPYFHNGSKDTLEDTVQHYLDFSTLSQNGKMRNPPLEFQSIAIQPQDIAPLAAFLRSLNEDYN